MKESFPTAIKNEFRKCGWYPFDSENVDYSECVVITVSILVIDSNPVKINKKNDFPNSRKECLTNQQSIIENRNPEQFKEKYQQEK